MLDFNWGVFWAAFAAIVAAKVAQVLLRLVGVYI
jgi:hypothetical protein